MRKIMSNKLVPVLLLVYLFIVPGLAYGAFSLSVSPYEGGYDLRYGKVNTVSGRINKEISVNITSDIGKQYRLTQMLLEPLTTPEGNTLPYDSFIVYGIRGSNQFGTLSVEQEIPVRLGRQVIYTSNQSGASDSFNLVYGFIVSGQVEPGSYRGKISFTLEPLDSTQSPVIAVLNVYADIEVESSVEVSTVSGSKAVVLKPDMPDEDAATVVFQVKGAFGKQFRILQVVTEQPISTEGELLGWQAINFIGKEAQKGMVLGEIQTLSAQPQIIYTSSQSGEADTFAVQYGLGNLADEKAGRYRASIKYIMEGTGFAKTWLLDTLALEIENPKTFELSVTPETGGLIQFRDIKPKQPPRIQEVVFKVNTNIGKRYQVNQKMLSLLTSKEGKVISSQYFTLKQESLETKGALKYPQKSEIKEGQMVLFVSDASGSSDEFKVIYELVAPPDVHYGDYATHLVYSVSEI